MQNDNVKQKEPIYHVRDPSRRFKRPPQRAPTMANDIYMSRKTNFKAAIKRSLKLLKDPNSSITIHGLGAAINKAIELGLHFQDKHAGMFKLAVTTSTVDLVDDILPTLEDEDPDTTTLQRKNSAIHIKVTNVRSA
ncbi:ribonucleases P/MRP protein subunit pop7 [Blyttiomyces sp. JEL0837]|nr:ribonucleases P/MRP protein subunit pop7 [Blyttiomyces sp. JEL0837]